MIGSIDFGSLASVTLKFAGGMTVGVIAGYCYFVALWRNVAELQSHSAAHALSLFILRFALLTAALVLLAKFGALPLLSGAVGIPISRWLLIRRIGTPS